MSAGDVGYIYGFSKDVADARVGDTITTPSAYMDTPGRFLKENGGKMVADIQAERKRDGGRG